MNPGRGTFQFSLCKLLLWTAVWAVYLGFLKAIEANLPFAVMLTLCLISILAVRIKWGLRGIPIATLVVSGCFVAMSLAVEVATGDTEPVAVWHRILFHGVLVYPFAIALAIGCYFIVHFVVIAVDRIDKLMGRRK